jgi:hypothetical protein
MIDDASKPTARRRPLGKKPKRVRKAAIQRVRPIVIQKWIPEVRNDNRDMCEGVLVPGYYEDVVIPDNFVRPTTEVMAQATVKAMEITGEVRIMRLLGEFGASSMIKPVFRLVRKETAPDGPASEQG